MASVNKVILVGNLGRDPEIRYAPSGDAICNVSIATTDTWKDKQTGETKSRWKSVPYAICECFIGAPIGTEFLIPGYKLKNETKDGERLLVLRDQYAAEFNGDWVNKMLAESKQKRVSA